MSARRTITRRLTTTVAAVALATGAAVTASPSAGAETTDLPSSVSETIDGSTQAALGSLVLSGGTVFWTLCFIGEVLPSPIGSDCPS